MSAEWNIDAIVHIGFGLVLVGAGIAVLLGNSVPLLVTSLVGAFWLGFTGWIKRNANARLHRILSTDTNMDLVMAKPEKPLVPPVPPNIPISNLVDQYVIGTDERFFPVIDNNRLVGMVCGEDVLKVPRERWDTTEVGEIMTAVGKTSK